MGFNFMFEYLFYIFNIYVDILKCFIIEQFYYFELNLCFGNLYGKIKIKMLKQKREEIVFLIQNSNGGFFVC